MAMGGSMKGHVIGGGNKGRPYGLMLLLAFGAACFGVVVLHKFRERRIFNLLVKEKDRDLISLHLLFQKERDYHKEVKRKNDEMKAKIYSLRTQKMELNSRILEMQSTISSLKAEQKTMELAFEEKKNEIKLLQEKEIDSNKENPQVISLTEILKQKEAEIENLKRRLEYPVNVLSVITDDPANPPANLTATRSIAWKDKSEVRGIKDEAGELHESTAGYGETDNSERHGDGSVHESTNNSDGESSRGSGGRRENGVKFNDRREMTGDQKNSHKEFSEKSNNEVQGKEVEDSQDVEGIETGEAKNITIATETIANNGVEVFKTKDENSGVEVSYGKEHGITGNEKLEKLNSKDDEGQRIGVNSKGGIKLEIPEHSKTGAAHREREKHGSPSRMKGKRWRILAKNRRYENSRNSEHNGDVNTSGRRFSKDALQSKMSKIPGELEKLDEGHNQNTGLKMRYESGQKNGDHVRLQGGDEAKDGRKEVREEVSAADVNLLKPQDSEDVENESIKDGNSGINQHIERRHEMDVQYEISEKYQHTIDVVPTNITAIVDGGETETAGDARKQKPDEAGQSEEQANGIQQQKVREVDGDSEAVKVVEKYEEAEDLEAADVKESETDKVMESRSKLEEEKEEYKEEADETEF